MSATANVSILIGIQARLAALDKAVSGFGSLASGIAAAAAAYVSMEKVISGSKEVLGMTDRLNDLSQKTNVSIARLMVLEQTFADFDLGGEAVNATLDKLSKNVVKAINNDTGNLADYFNQLGINVRELSELQPEQIFERVGRELAKMENPTLRNAVAMKLMGEAGTKVALMFKDEGVFADAAKSLGTMPEILQKNAELFSRIADLIERLKNKSLQFFAGLWDQIGSMMRAPFEAIDAFDFAPFGQRFGALIAIWIKSIQDGSFAEILSLTIQAGVEEGIEMARRAWNGLGEQFGATFWKGVLAVTVSVGNAAVRGMVELITTPVSYISAAFRWLEERASIAGKTIGNFLSSGLVDAMNRAIRTIESGLNWLIDKWNALMRSLPGGSQYKPFVPSASFTPLEFKPSTIQAARTFADILAEQSESARGISDWIQNGLGEQLNEVLLLLGSSTEETGKQVTAREKLNALIAQQIAMTEKLNTPTPGIPQPTLPGIVATKDTFAQKSDQKYSDFQNGVGDFGVTKIAAAKAAFQDYVTAIGTGAQQIYRAIGTVMHGIENGLATSMEGLLKGTMTWGEALRNIGSSVMDGVISAISRMFAEWIVGRLAVKAVEVAAGGAEAAAKAPGALFSSISSFGVAGVVGIAAVLAGIAALSGAFYSGGYTGNTDPRKAAGVVHGSEYVFDHEVTRKAGPGFLANLAESIRNDRPLSLQTGNASGAKFAGSGGAAQAVALFDNRVAMNDYIRSHDGRASVAAANRAWRHKTA